MICSHRRGSGARYAMHYRTVCRFGAVVLSTLALYACGGGGGGGSSTLSVSASTTRITQTAAVTDAPPTAYVQLTLSKAPTQSIYVGYSTTQNAIASVGFATTGDTTGNVAIGFQPPSQLGPGVYNDTLQLAACYDQNCSQQLRGSPISISVQFTVTAGTGSSGGGSSSSSGGGSSSSGGSSGSASCNGCGLSVVEIPANDLVYDSSRQLIYLSVPSIAGIPQGNTITAIDPASGTIVATRYAGSEPNVLALSDDGQYLYAGIDGAASVQRFKLPGLTPDISFPLGSDSFFGPFVAMDVQVAPGAAHTTAVSRGNPDVSAEFHNLVIYDDGALRGSATNAFASLYDSLQWGNDGNTLYAANYESSGFDFYALSVNAQGAQQVQDYPNAFDRYDARIHYDAPSGLIYSDDGHVLRAASGQRVGTYQDAGPMVPDPAANRAYFAEQNDTGYSIDAFDLAHFTAKPGVSFTGGSEFPRRLIRWGSVGLAMNTSGGPVYLVSPGGSGVGTIGVNTLVGNGSHSQNTVAVQANDLVWDASHKLIYASVPSTAASNGNSIVAIDPGTGKIAASQFAGSEPNHLAISGDGSFLYVGLDGSGSVARFKLPGLTPDITIALGSGSDGSYHALDLQVAPGAPRTIAVSLGVSGFSPQALGGVVIYDDGQARAQAAPGFGAGGGGLYDSLQWGSTANALYAANRDDSGFDFYTLSVDAGGVQQDSDYGADFPGYYNSIHYDAGTGLVYGDDGHAVIPATGAPAGQFDAEGLMVPDSSVGAAFFLGQDYGAYGNPYVVESFDLQHYLPRQAITLGNLDSAPKRLIRWGADGLAFNTGANVYLINGSFVSGANGSNALQAGAVAAKFSRIHRAASPVEDGSWHVYVWAARR